MFLYSHYITTHNSAYIFYNILEVIDSAQAEDIVCGFVARIGEERLPQRVMFGELVWGKGYSGGQEKDWMVHLKEDMPAFGMKFEGW